MSYQVPTSAATNTKPYRLYLILSLLLVLVFAIAFGGYKIVFNSSSASAAEVTTTASPNKPVEETKGCCPGISFTRRV